MGLQEVVQLRAVQGQRGRRPVQAVEAQHGQQSQSDLHARIAGGGPLHGPQRIDERHQLGVLPGGGAGLHGQAITLGIGQRRRLGVGLPALPEGKHLLDHRRIGGRDQRSVFHAKGHLPPLWPDVGERAELGAGDVFIRAVGSAALHGVGGPQQHAVQLRRRIARVQDDDHRQRRRIGGHHGPGQFTAGQIQQLRQRQIEAPLQAAGHGGP